MHEWNPQDYAGHSAVQEGWALDCLDRLRLRGNERILDIGCGDGRVSAELAGRVARGSVLGVDASLDMIAHARETHAGANLKFAVVDATRLAFDDEFDLIVSFNCLHWTNEHAAVQAGIARALVPGGRIFLHFGGQGNVEGVMAVVEQVAAGDAWRAAFAGLSVTWCFPEPGAYRRLVEQAGLVPERVELLSRPTPHKDEAALAGWLRTTWHPYLDRVPGERRPAFVEEVVAAYLAANPADERGRIWVDSVRLEVEARRPQATAAPIIG